MSGRTCEVLARLLWSAAAALAPREQAQWVRAMAVESAALEGVERLAWTAGCLLAVARLRASRSPFAAAVAALVPALVWLDWTADGDGPALALLAVGAATVAFLHPRRIGATALLVGGALPAAHGFADLTDLWLPPYQYAPLTPGDWLVLASLALPTTAFAALGARVRHAWERRR